jgi:putative Holliday junction resolvase
VIGVGEERNDIIVLTDEEGAEHEFQVVDYFNVDEKEYAILLPMNDFEEDDEEGEALIFRVEDDEDGDQILVEIEDDDEWERAAAEWEERLAEEDYEEDEE